MSKTRSARTMENKARSAATRLRRLERAAQRRTAARTAKVQAKRNVRERRKVYYATSPKARAKLDPTSAGAVQFGAKAAGHHVNQREQGLARALTPAEFHKLQQKSGKKAKRDETEAILNHIASGE